MVVVWMSDGGLVSEGGRKIKRECARVEEQQSRQAAPRHVSKS